MAQWRVKELSTMTNISVRMLHHYDKIGLLKPSARSSNGYRWYSETDLARLQQIVALKFFGFGLRQIKTMLKQAPGIYEQLQTQHQMLADQTEHLRRVQNALATILEDNKTAEQPFDWQKLVSLIERFRMLDELKDTWLAKLPEKYQMNWVKLKQAYPKEMGGWEEAIKAVNSGELGDPEGPDGIKIAKAFLAATQVMVTSEEIKKQSKKRMTPEQSKEISELIAQGRMGGIPLSPEGNMWLGRALNAYRLVQWQELLEAIAQNRDTDPASAAGKKLAAQWRNLVEQECHGADKDYFFGMKLVIEAVRNKTAMRALAAEGQQPAPLEIMGALKGMQDPMTIDWILKALQNK